MTEPDFFKELPNLKVPDRIPDFLAEIPEQEEVRAKKPVVTLPVEEISEREAMQELPEDISPMAMPYLAQSMAFATQAGRRGISRSGKRILSGLTFGLSELIPGLKTEEPKTKTEKELAVANEIMGSLLPWGAFEKYVVAPVGARVGAKIAAKAAHRKILKGLGAQLGTKFAIRGGAAPAIDSLKNFIRTGDVPSLDELAKEGLIVGGIGGAFDMLGEVALPTMRSLSNIAKKEGRSLWDVYKEFGRAIRNRGFSFLKGTAKPVTPDDVLEIGKDFAKQKGFPVEAPITLEKVAIPTEITPKKVAKITKVPSENVIKKDEPVEAQLLRDNQVTKAFDKLSAKLNVEAPFKKVGANETGFRVKTYFDQVSKNIEKGEKVQKDIKKLKLTDEQLSELALASEKATPPKDPELKKGYKIVRDYFDTTLKDLKDAGVLKGGFVENRIEAIKDDIARTQELLKKAKTTQAKRNYEVELQDLRTELQDVQDIRFVSIPANLWFDNKVVTDPAMARKVVRFLNKKRRKTATIKDLINADIIKPEDVNMNEIISYYSRKAGRDVALGKIIKAAKNDGLATLEEKPGYVKVPGYVAPELSKYYLHPAFADYIHSYTEPKKFSNWEKLTRRTKGWSFYNPVIMPINDLYQHAAAVLGDVRNIPTLGKSWVKAFKDSKAKTKDFWNAYENGLFSQPFIPEDTSFKSYADRMKKETGSPFVSMFKNIPAKLHDKLYDAIGSVAWGMDKTIRMATYNHLKKQGLTDREAAQTAALFHGDYASVPPDTRRQLNKFFWTPTFKIVMGKMQKDAIKGAFKVGESILRGKEIPKAEAAKFKGLLGALTIIAGLDLWLTSHGFDREIFGLRYSTPTVTEEGKRKQLWMNLSNPLNLIWKFAFRGYESFTKPGTDRNLWQFIRRNKFEYAIPVQILWEISENKRTDRQPIYEADDDFATKLRKSAIYAGKRVFPLIGKVDKTNEFVKPEARTAMQQQLGIIPSYMPSLFPYVTDRKKILQKRAVQRVLRKFMEKSKRLRKEGKSITEKDFEKYKEEIRKITSN